MPAGEQGDDSSGEVETLVSGVEGVPASESSADTFLSDLETASASSGQIEGTACSTRAVTWHDDRDLPVCAEDVVAAYRDAGSCELICGGYVDIKGNVWGAIVRRQPDWVDIVYITVEEGGERSTARIVRLEPK